MRCLAVALILALVPALALAQKNTPFEPGCDMPFEGARHEIDDKCGIEGSAGDNQKHNDASHAKSNFCASSDPVVVTLAFFDRLQRRADAKEIPSGTNQYPDDRDDLHHITTLTGKSVGEGDRVRLVAWIMKAKYSNEQKRKKGENGEHVNCNHVGEEWNDIHIALAANKNDDECTTVTAEMSPHQRPDMWTPANLANLQFPVRVTGQLFYDTIHRPCENGKKSSPARRSSWEIHPVYAMDVCRKKAVAQCPASGGAEVWTPLEEFLLNEPEEDTHEDADE